MTSVRLQRYLLPIIGFLLTAGVGAALHAADVAEAVLKAEQQRVEAVAKATRTAVAIFGPPGSGGGSGVVITPDGYALTNFHVAKPSGDFMKCGMEDGRLYDAVIVGTDPTGDVALIKLFGRDDFPTAEMADSDDVRVGEWCFAVGNPFLLATDFQPTVTYGIVSGVHRYQYPAGTLLEYTDCIQTDAAINPGNSGGPLFNAEGQLIGINGRGSFEKRGRVNVGVGYAISINQIKNFLGYLHSGRIVDHATLGASVSSDEKGRVIVTNLLESSDAYRRGLRYGDEILAFGGRQINTVNGFKNVLGIFPRGWRVPLSYQRDGQRFDVMVRLSGVHSREELLAKVQRAVPDPSPPGDEKKKPEGTPPGKLPDSQQPKEQPAPEPDEGRPGGKRGPIQMPFHQQPQVPDHLAKYFEARAGYANYYFNQLNRDRVWQAFSKHGSFSGATAPWMLEGDLAAGGTAKIVLGDEVLAGQFPAGAALVELEKEVDQQLDPPGSGGLLLALHQWQQLLVHGPESYGEVYYLGTVPLPGREGLFDCLVATRGAVESRFIFDPQNGHLVALEMYPDIHVDPCEIYFHDYAEAGDRQLPHRLEVRYGDSQFSELRVKSYDLSAEKKKEA